MAKRRLALGESRRGGGREREGAPLGVVVVVVVVVKNALGSPLWAGKGFSRRRASDTTKRPQRYPKIPKRYPQELMHLALRIALFFYAIVYLCTSDHPASASRRGRFIEARATGRLALGSLDSRRLLERARAPYRFGNQDALSSRALGSKGAFRTER